MATAGMSGLAMLGALVLNAVLLWRYRTLLWTALMGPRIEEVLQFAPTGESNIVRLQPRTTAQTFSRPGVPLRLVA